VTHHLVELFCALKRILPLYNQHDNAAPQRSSYLLAVNLSSTCLINIFIKHTHTHIYELQALNNRVI